VASLSNRAPWVALVVLHAVQPWQAQNLLGMSPSGEPGMGRADVLVGCHGQFSFGGGLSASNQPRPLQPPGHGQPLTSPPPMQ
jgi:hypothetical protein